MLDPSLVKYILLAVTMALACGPQKNTGDTGDTTSSTGDAPTTSPTSSSSPTTPDPTVANSTSGSSGDTGDSTGGSADICTGFCDKLTECELDGGFDGCPCYGLDDSGPKCQAAWQMTANCFEAASCAELNTGEGPCWELFNTGYEQCLFGEDGCEGYVLIGGGEPPGTCTFGEDCLDMPTKEVHCEGDTCSCKIGETEVGTCPAGDVCRTYETDLKVAECCA